MVPHLQRPRRDPAPLPRRRRRPRRRLLREALPQAPARMGEDDAGRAGQHAARSTSASATAGRRWSGWRSWRRSSCTPRSRWRRAPTRPTVLAFDLDPGPPADVVDCCRVALRLRELFGHFGVECFPKTSGSKGMQVYVPLNTQGQLRATTKPFAKAIAQLLEKQTPDLVVSKMKKVERKGKVFVDWSPEPPRKTTIAVYSLRARERPTVSTPVTWEEVEAAAEQRRRPTRSSSRPPTCWSGSSSTATSSPRCSSWSRSCRSSKPRRSCDQHDRAGGRPAAARLDLVEAADRGRVGRLLGDLGVVLGLGEDLLDRVGEGVEALLGLGLGRLDHQRLVDQQREVDGRRVEAEVEQALGEVEGGEARAPSSSACRRGRTRACSGGRRRPAGARRRGPRRSRAFR